MGNNTRIATLLNGAISLLAVVAITLVCIVPTAFAEDGANTSDVSLRTYHFTTIPRAWK